jgi:hypothetical protein
MKRHLLLLLAAFAGSLVPAVPASGYTLILPLQYNAFQPVSARALGCGDCWAMQAGLGSVFAGPAGLAGRPGLSVEAGSSGMSAFRSHAILDTRASRTLPSTVAAGWGTGRQYLALGARRAQRAILDFDDPRRPQAAERMDLGLDQLRGGWSIGIGQRTRLAVALGFDQASMDWTDPSHRLAKAALSGPGYAIGMETEIRSGLSFGLFYLARTRFSGSVAFDYLDTLRTLEVFGTVPSVSGLAARYQLDSGLVATGQLEFTGWSSVIDGYVGTTDWHVGIELEATPWLALRTGGYSLATPIDPGELARLPGFHDLYFVTAGAGVRCWRINADLGLATSYPFSGRGQNQNIVSFSLGYSQ